MAQRRVLEVVDDLTGEVSENYRTVIFGFDGKNYSIDLSRRNAEKFVELLEPYLKVATPLRQHYTNQPPKLADVGLDSKVVRDWARRNGYDINDRGRISQKIVAAYKEAKDFSIAS